MIITLVLAAGRGTRIGGPKALLAWPLLPQTWIVPLAVAHVEQRSESDRVIVVTRDDIATVLRKHAPIEFGGSGRGELVISTAADALGPAGSIAAAMPALSTTMHEDADLILITPVDCPPVLPSTAHALLDALRDDTGALAAKPRFEGRGGHPVAVRRSALQVYALHGDGDAAAPPPLRDVLRAVPTVSVAVDDPMIAWDIDDAESLAAWGRLHGGAVEEPAFFE